MALIEFALFSLFSIFSIYVSYRKYCQIIFKDIPAPLILEVNIQYIIYNIKFY